MATKSTMEGLFPSKVVKEVYSKVRDHSSLIKLSQQKPVSFTGNDVFTFSLDGEVAIVGEGAQKPAGAATIAPVSIVPIKVVYQHRISDEFLRASEEDQLNMLAAFNDGFSRKIASGLDIMAMHGVNPATMEASNKIGTNHFDTVTSVTYTEGEPEAALTEAVDKIGDNDVTGYALSRTFGAALGAYKEAGVSQYPEFKLGGNPGALGGTACDVNSTVGKGTAHTMAYVGDFAKAFRWGYAAQMPIEIIEYGDPDGQGDLKRTNEIVIRAETYIGWGILDKGAFSRVVGS